MNFDALEARVDKLEKGQADWPLLAQRIDALANRIEELMASASRRETLLQEVRDHMLRSGPACPKPGLCLNLETRMAVVETVLARNETEAAVTSRGWRSAGIIVASLAAASGLLVGLWKAIEMLVHKKTP